MLRAIASVGGLTLASRILGFARDVLSAAILGAGPINDAFVVAFRLPNHFRALFAEGAFAAAFVPMFTGKLVQEGKAGATLFAERILALMLPVQLLLLALFLAGMPYAVHVLAPGFGADPVRFDLAVLFGRITFPYLLFISIETLFACLLNGLGRFAAAAAAPVLLNLCMIGALLGAAAFETPGHAMSWAVLVAGALQFLWLWVAARRAGVALRLTLPSLDPATRDFLRKLGPAALGAGVVQIGLFADTLIASFLRPGAISALWYADRLNQLPIGVVGVAIGTVLLPELARLLKEGNASGAADAQNRAIELGLALTLPALAAFAVVPGALIAGLFERGAFDAAATAAAAGALQAYAIGLPAFILVRCFLPGFYARGDTATPVKIALASVAVNIGAKLLLVWELQEVGLALGTSLAAWVNLVLLAVVLWRRGDWRGDGRLRRQSLRLAMASAGLAATLALTERIATPWLMAQIGSNAVPYTQELKLALLVVAGGVSFLALALPLRALPIDLLRRRRVTKDAAPPGPEGT